MGVCIVLAWSTISGLPESRTSQYISKGTVASFMYNYGTCFSLYRRINCTNKSLPYRANRVDLSHTSSILYCVEGTWSQ